MAKWAIKYYKREKMCGAPLRRRNKYYSNHGQG